MIKTSQIKFFIYRPKKKCLTQQQRKIRDLSALSKKCLTNEASQDKASLFSCIFSEAGRQLQNI